MNNVCISILNYNNGTTTIRCLQSILSQTCSQFQVVIVDNCSTDDSVTVISEYLDRNTINHVIFRENEMHDQYFSTPGSVGLVIADRNDGFSSGTNIGFLFARNCTSCKQILLLNNDVELNPDFLDKIIRSYNAFSEKHNSDRIALGASEYSFSGKKRHDGFHYLNLPTALVFSFPHPAGLKYIVGSCIFVPVDAPLMDDSFFLYYDDASYSIILRRNKYILLSCKEAKFSHEMGSTTKHNAERNKIIFRSMKRFYRFYYPYLFPIVVLIRFFLAIFMGRFRLATELLRISLQPLS